jgi:hypothetical protein
VAWTEPVSTDENPVSWTFGTGTEQIPDPHAYQTTAPPGVRKLGLAYEVVGANGRRILLCASPEGVWLGSVLLADVGALLNLADLLRGCAHR